MKKITLIAIVLALLTGALLGGIIREARPSGAEAAGDPVSALVAQQRARDTVGVIRNLQAALQASPDDARALTLLGLAYQQRYRESADPSYLNRAAGLFRRTLELKAGDPTATSGLAGLALSQHRFREALALAREARRLDPASVAPYGAVGDALIELGRYDEAFATFDRMNELKPNLASYARVAYARELLGQPQAAIEAMSLALDVGAGRPEPAAWALVELGKLHFGQGRLGEARRSFRAALVAFPGYVYALDWLARSEAASGRFERAVGFSQRAVDAVPLPQFVATLADIELARGNRAAAREQYALMGTIQRLLRANGVNSDLELALFRVDHGIRLGESLQLARAARADRPSIYGDDVLAWALARSGRCAEALGFSKRSLRLGTQDASFYFHRGMIERCLGRGEQARTWFARALETNPHFSLIWADTARRYAS